MNGLSNRIITPFVAVGLALGIGACDMDMNVNVDGDGVPLAELDLTGEAPDEITLAGPDNVNVFQGDTFAVTVEGDSDITGKLRFDRDGNGLAIYREGDWRDSEQATVNVTVPSVRELAIAGSGTLDSAILTGNAEVSIAGSGIAKAMGVDSDRLDVSIAGSGRFEGAGKTDTLDLNIMGSGAADMAGLTAGDADISIAGSGNGSFASDGNVEASVMGSGTVTVTGNATCTTNAVGSGTLVCTKAAEEAGDSAAE